MKLCRIIIVACLVCFSINLNAQVFIGGNVGFNATGGKNADNSKKPSDLSLNLSPKIGTFLSEKAAVGIAVNFATSSSNNNADVQTISKSSSFGITPFLRYYAVNIDKFSIFGQANAGISFSGSSLKFGNTETEGPKSSTISLNIVPGISYALNDKISLETSINVLNFGINQTTIKNGSAKSTSTGFGIGAGINNIVNVGNITIGAIYKF
jgi:opacity protein-like surface antigen